MHTQFTLSVLGNLQAVYWFTGVLVLEMEETPLLTAHQLVSSSPGLTSVDHSTGHL